MNNPASLLERLKLIKDIDPDYARLFNDCAETIESLIKTNNDLQNKILLLEKKQ
jgi:hypothetical protein